MHHVIDMTIHRDNSLTVTLNKIETTELLKDIYFDPEHLDSIMQFTGLFDKNGKEIYESDRIRFYRKGAFVTAVIVFENGLFCLLYEDGYKNMYPLNPENYEVVGNIFDIPKY
jgi:YopX protein